MGYRVPRWKDSVEFTDSPFCLSDYKEDLGKNYSQIILYLCTQNSLENTIENNEWVKEETFDRIGTASSVTDECAKFQPVDMDLWQKIEKGG